jgi:hypothetical protein
MFSNSNLKNLGKLYTYTLDKYGLFICLSYSLLFRKEHLELPLNIGEKRESLIILEKIGLISGLLRSLSTDAQVK